MLNNFACYVTGHYVPPVGTGDARLKNADLSIGYVQKQIQYLNKCDHDVWVVERSGLRYKFRRSHESGVARKFIVRITWTLLRHHVDDFLIGLGNYREIRATDVRKIAEMVIDARSNSYGHIFVMLDYEVDPSVFLNEREAVYLMNHDIVISCKGTDQYPVHPYSQSTPVTDKISRDLLEPNESTACVNISFIDNTGRLAPRFVNVMGSIDKLVPRADLNMADGLHVARKKKNLHSGTEWYIDTTIYSLEEGEKILGVYRSAEEAESLGDPKTIARLKLVEAEQELLDSKQELSRSALEIERLSSDSKLREQEYKALQGDLARTHDILKARDEAARLVLSSEQMFNKHILDAEKQKQEARSARRKEISELTKFVPSLIVSLLGLIIAGLKLKAAFSQ